MVRFIFNPIFLIAVCALLLPSAAIATDLHETKSGLSDGSDKISTDSGRNLRERKSERLSRAIPGAYIITLRDDADSKTVQSVAAVLVSDMQVMNQAMIENGTFSSTGTSMPSQVKLGNFFSKVGNAFTVTGIPEKLASSLVLKYDDVIRVEKVKFFSIDTTLDYDSKKALKNQDPGASTNQDGRLMQTTCNQVVPWGVKRVGGPYKNTNPNGRIFVIGTGIAQVRDLVINTTLSKNFVGGTQNKPRWSDGHGHGTHMAGTIAALDNCYDVVGVVPGATLVALRVLDNTGYGTDTNVILAIEYAMTVGKAEDVIYLSMSFAGISTLLDTAIYKAAERFKVAVAAGDFDTPKEAIGFSPGRNSGTNIFTISCINNLDQLCSRSNYGRPIVYAAPGLSIVSLSKTSGGSKVTLSGTASSTAHVAGLLFVGPITNSSYVKNDKDAINEPIAHGPALAVPAKPVSQKPVTQKPLTAKPVGTGAGTILFNLTLTTDKYGIETGWELRKADSSSSLVMNRAAGFYSSNKFYNEKINITQGSYVFTMTDTSVDGICCKYGNGSYSVKVGGFQFVSGGIFEAKEQLYILST